MGSLSAAAFKHISSIECSPYSRPSTPAQRTALQQDLAKKLQKMAARIQQFEKPPTTVDAPSVTSLKESDAVKPPVMNHSILHSQSGSRPGTACLPLHEMVMQRPSSRGQIVSSSWSGPLSALARDQLAASEGGATSMNPVHRLGSPMLSSRMNPLRQSTPAGIGGGRRSMTPIGVQHRPGTSSGVTGESELGPKLKLASLNPTRGHLYAVFQVGITLNTSLCS